MHEFVSFIRDTPEQRYQNLLNDRPHIVQRVPQHYIASYLGISRGSPLKRIKSGVLREKVMGSDSVTYFVIVPAFGFTIILS